MDQRAEDVAEALAPAGGFEAGRKVAEGAVDLLVGGPDAGAAEERHHRRGERRREEKIGARQDEVDARLYAADLLGDVHLVGRLAQDEERVRVEDLRPGERRRP